MKHLAKAALTKLWHPDLCETLAQVVQCEPEWIDRGVDAVARLKAGHGLEKGVDIGPMICRMDSLDTPKFTAPPNPFGDWKQSSLGRECAKLGATCYMGLKYVCIGNL